MTPLTKLENGIMTGDWALVCEAFNKLTGKKLAPPLPPEPKVPKFSVKSATKRELYGHLETLMDMGPMKSYSIEELREIAAIQEINSTSDIVEDKVDEIYPTQSLEKGVFLDGFRYHSGRSKLLPMDKEKVKATLDPQLAKVGDPTAEYNPRQPPKKMEMCCLKCSKKFKNLVSLGVEVDGEIKALCPVCAESV